MKLVTSAQMKEIELRATQLAVPESELMLNAGSSVAEAIYLAELIDRDGDAYYQENTMALILAGAGNNGGDAMVVASLLKQELPDLQVRIYFYNRPRPKNGFNNKLTYTEAENQTGQSINDENDWADFCADLEQAHLVVDGLLGAGLTRDVTGKLANIIRQVNEVKEARSFDPYPLSVVAIDVPSGINSDTGQAMGIALKADLTVTLGMPKQGLISYEALEYTGVLTLGDIGLPPKVVEEFENSDAPLFVLSDNIKRWLPSRPSSGHKGTFGRLMVVSGSDEFLGAPYLSVVAAMRAGAGLVTLAASRNVIAVMAARSSENTYFELTEATLSSFAAKLVDYRAALIGPGLGENSNLLAQLLAIDSIKKLPLVIDADGLNYLAHTPEWWASMSKGNILTPHPAELSRLTGSTIGEIEANRLESAQKAAQKFGQVVVLKGAYTVIAAPDGRIAVNPAANSALATAGSGDVLAGICGGLLAQAVRFADFDTFKIACCGVYLHAMAGELAKRDKGAMGVLAGDLLPLLPLSIEAIKQGESLE
ncbi:NAD(P)H-hydrate dehydratase [Candidatus Chlorohelix sp.]|uniref:NAD(P)H-hydrate dehydratase n=1 Tax=Candidatus Chlorohelix sp. TaxID=3139201 RepID=UPI00306ED3A7